MRRVVLLANTSWYLYNFRLSLAEHLRGRGMQVVMAAPRDRFSVRIEEAGFQYQPWNLARGRVAPLAQLQAIWDVISLYRRLRPVLVHHFTVQSVLYGSLAARVAGVPATVNAVTGLGYLFIRSGWMGAIQRRLLLPFYRWALRREGQHTIFQNPDDRRTLLELDLIDDHKASIIPGSGVDVGRFTPQPEPDGTPVILMASRMLWDKGVGELIAAVRLLKDRGYDFRLVLAGSTDAGNPSSVSRDQLERWAEESFIEWDGYAEDMLEMYASSQVVVLPSYREGLPKSLVEAAACGRPLVATDVPGCREIVRHGINGFLVPLGAVEGLADALATLLGDRHLRATMGERGRQMVVENLSSEIVNSQTWRVYQSLLPEEGSADRNTAAPESSQP